MVGFLAVLFQLYELSHVHCGRRPICTGIVSGAVVENLELPCEVVNSLRPRELVRVLAYTAYVVLHDSVRTHGHTALEWPFTSSGNVLVYSQTMRAEYVTFSQDEG
jgi:hypothetical protein